MKRINRKSVKVEERREESTTFEGGRYVPCVVIREKLVTLECGHVLSVSLHHDHIVGETYLCHLCGKQG